MATEPEHSAVGDVVGEARLALVNLRQQARPRVLLPPIILLASVFVVAYLFRPGAGSAVAREDYETFFEAAAAVLGTILIAIVLQANLFRGPSLRRMLIYGLLYIAPAEAAALLALLPGGSAHFTGVLFGLTVSGGVGALGAVVFIGVRLLEAPAPELELQEDGSARIEEPSGEPESPVSPVRSAPGPEAEIDPRREQRRAARTGRPGRESAVVLHPDAVDDLRQLGRRESGLVLSITERMLGNDKVRRKRAVQVDGGWSELRAGGLRIVFRPLSAEEAAKEGHERGSLVRRILAGPAAQAWLRAAAEHNPPVETQRTTGVRLDSGTAQRRRASSSGD